MIPSCEAITVPENAEEMIANLTSTEKEISMTIETEPPQGENSMRKKVKLFALEKRPYERLFQMFKDNYVEIRVSYCVNRYLKEFLFNKIVNTGMIYANNRIVPFLSKSLLPTCIKRITQRQGGGFAGVLLGGVKLIV